MSENGDLAALFAALAKAQGEFPPIVKHRTATGSSFSYDYAPLEDVLAIVRPVLSKHGLAVSQWEVAHEGQLMLRSILAHEGGGMLDAYAPLGDLPESEQTYGKRLTYRRRYAILGILGVAAENEDDDAQPPKPKRERKPKPKPEPPAEPEPEPQPEGDLTIGAQVAQVMDRLRDLEDQLGLPGTDWTLWVRGKLGLHGADKASDDDYRRALPLLIRERDRLVAELAGAVVQGEA